MRIFVILLFCCISFHVQGQEYFFINAENGLNVRDSGKLSAQKIGKIRYGAMVEKTGETTKVITVNDGGQQISGKFVKVKYNSYLIPEEAIEGYVFDAYLTAKNSENIIKVTPIDKETYTRLFKEGAAMDRGVLKKIESIDAINKMLGDRIQWYDGEQLKSISLQNGKKLLFRGDIVDFGFSEGYSGYYPEEEILVLEGGHSSDMCFSLKTGESELTIGNPQYIVSSPRNSYRLNGYFGGQECVSYFFQKKENGSFKYLSNFSYDFDVCTFKSFDWIGETKFIYKKIEYTVDAVNGKEVYFKGEIHDKPSLEEERNKKRKIALNFTNALRLEKDLAPLLSDKWTFVYHEDNRCAGSTDGEKTYNDSAKIDADIVLKVTNNSDSAWACEKKDSYDFELTFNLQKKINSEWNRIELQNDSYSITSGKENNAFYILGAGESDYIKIYINDDNLITSLLYGSEDPG